VVGTNFVAPDAKPGKKDHVGLFIQDRGNLAKGFIKHYDVHPLLGGSESEREREVFIEEEGAVQSRFR
jgi:hypothetical protein